MLITVLILFIILFSIFATVYRFRLNKVIYMRGEIIDAEYSHSEDSLEKDGINHFDFSFKYYNELPSNSRIVLSMRKITAANWLSAAGYKTLRPYM